MFLNTCKWKKSPVFPDNYLVSENGEVFSVATNKNLKPNTDKDGYKYYTLCVNGSRKTVKAHRLVALAFLDNPMNKPAVDHINGIKTDNRVCNLRWVTNKENANNPVTMPRLLKAAESRLPALYEAATKRNFGRKPVRVEYRNGATAIYPSLKRAAEETKTNYYKLSEIVNGKRTQRKEFTVLWASEIEEFPIAVTKKRFPED